jgi:hypothetical protein
MKENTLNNCFHNARPQVSHYKLLAVCCLLLMISCKAKKQLVVNRPAPVAAVAAGNDKRDKLNAIRASQAPFTTFSGKARTKLALSGSSNDVTLNIRIKRDQKIWVSITAIAGIEVARALITPDSIKLLNKFQSVYISKPFSYLYKYTGGQFSYKTLESVLVGNVIPELLNERADFQTNNGSLTLTGNLQEVIYKLMLGPDLKATQTNLDNSAAGQSLQVVNGTFIQVGTYAVPSQIDISSVVKDKKIQVNLHYVKIEFDKPLDFPFSIPASYSPAD